ncbi:MAG TPA: PRC-barrel domain-containing protein [Candidatus Saccharimonadia bacterium]|nr:PRC-barrel domain-containing protein [Candidatus Saccharimonadia bacterium]
MYALASQMDSLPIISLQTGEAVAWSRQPIIDVGSLEILAFRCESARKKSQKILMARDIRQLASDCIIIDDEDELTDPAEIVRMKSMISSSYNPIDKLVVSDTGRKLGSVEDFTINLESNRVQKLHVRQSLLRSWMGSSLVVDRTQIIDIAPHRIVVRDSTVKATLLRNEPIPESPS